MEQLVDVGVVGDVRYEAVELTIDDERVADEQVESDEQDVILAEGFARDPPVGHTGRSRPRRCRRGTSGDEHGAAVRRDRIAVPEGRHDHSIRSSPEQDVRAQDAEIRPGSSSGWWNASA